MNRKYLDNLKEAILNLENPQDIDKFLPHMSAYEFIYECNKNRLSSYAINYLGRRYTYEEFFENVKKYAKGYKELGVKPKDRVGLSMLATPEGIMSFYALNLLGAEVFMINGTHEKDAIRGEIKRAKADLIIMNDIFYDKDISSYCDEFNTTKVVTVGLDESTPLGFYGDIAKLKFVNVLKSMTGYRIKDDKVIPWKEFVKISDNSKLEVKPFYEKGAGAVISGTSGSTGDPSYPVLTNDSLNASALQLAMSCTDFEPGDAHLTTLPLWILYSLYNCVQEVFVFNAEVELDPIFDSKHVSKRFKQYRFNHWNTIPAYINDMVKDAGMNSVKLNGRMKTVTTGGDFRTPKTKELGEKTLKKAGSEVEVGQGYGSTQQGVCFGYTYKKGCPADSIGYPLVGNRFKIIDEETNEELGPNQEGLLYTYSPTIMIGYDNDPEKTEFSLSKDENGLTWYYTEDYAMYDTDGRVYILDRAGRVVMTKDSFGNATKFFPGKIKQIISTHPYINECEVVAIPDDKRIAVPVAYIVLSNEKIYSDTFVEEIKNYCLEMKMEPYTIPVDFVFVSEIPKKPSKKADYNKMRTDYINNKEQVHTRKRTIFNKR